jgi:hypothetical protein
VATFKVTGDRKKVKRRSEKGPHAPSDIWSCGPFRRRQESRRNTLLCVARSCALHRKRIAGCCGSFSLNVTRLIHRPTRLVSQVPWNDGLGVLSQWRQEIICADYPPLDNFRINAHKVVSEFLSQYAWNIQVTLGSCRIHRRGWTACSGRDNT